MARKVKVIKVRYTFFGNKPNTRQTEKAIERWLNKGYRLQSQQETDVGCCRQLLIERGNTILTFIQE